jgi:hypothetical protein
MNYIHPACIEKVMTRAGHKVLVGRIWPAGRTFHTPAIYEAVVVTFETFINI